MNPSRIGGGGLALIRNWEGCALKAYPDPGSDDGNPWTIGYGSTGADIRKGLTWTKQECENRLATDLCKYEAAVRNAIGDAPTTQNQFDAFIALAYNIGISAFEGSTALRRHKSGDHKGAAEAIGWWNKNAGHVMHGLTNRRAAEAALYRKPT